MKSFRALSLQSSCAALAAFSLWLGQANAVAADVTIPGLELPIISSYAPPSAPVGATAYANLVFQGQGKPVMPASIEFPRVGGGVVTAPVVMEAQTLIRFSIPSGAASGQPTLTGPNGLRRERQVSFSVITNSQITRGLTILNMTQYSMGSVKNGTTELLPGGRRVPQRNAVFVNLSMTMIPHNLNIALVRLGGNNQVIPVLNLLEQAGGPVPGTRIPPIRATLRLDRLTVPEILGANTGSAEWKVFHRGQDRRMLVNVNGRVTLEERVSGQVRGSATFTLKEVSWSDDAGAVQFALQDASGNTGETLVLHPPFDAFAANQLGQFTFQDGVQPVLSSGPGDNTSVAALVPLFIRRVR